MQVAQEKNRQTKPLTYHNAFFLQDIPSPKIMEIAHCIFSIQCAILK
jgi:hypothetical protein